MAKRKGNYRRGQREPAYEPTLDEIKRHCAEIRRTKPVPENPERQDFIPKVYSLDAVFEAIREQ